MTDVWEMFRLIVEQRKRREVDPTMQMLRHCLEELKGGGDVYARERLQEMAEFFETGLAAYEEMKQLSPQTLRGLVKAKGKVRKLLSLNTK
jgi:DNA-binding transcriptional regulator GbsR (MarR family)